MTGLSERQDVIVRVLVVGADAHAENRRAPAKLALAHEGGHLGLGLDRVDGVEAGLDRFEIQAFDVGFVHHRVIDSGDLGVVAGQFRIGDQAHQNGLGTGFGQVAQGDEAAVGGLVCGNDHGLRGRAVDVVIETVARLYRGVHARYVDAPGAVVRRGGRGIVAAGYGVGIGRNKAVQAFQALHVAIGVDAVRCVGGLRAGRAGHDYQTKRAGQSRRAREEFQLFH